MLAKILIKPILRLHSFCYTWAGRYAVILGGGVHPKHEILRYKQWFLENIEPRWTVLDIGCNTGTMPYSLAEKAAFVYGIEINENHIAVAKTRHASDNIEYICADATIHNYDMCQSIDCVTMSNVLEHVEHRVEFLKKIIAQVRWNDRNNKRFLFRVPTINREWIVLYKKQLGLDHRLDSTHQVEYTLEQFTAELKQADILIKQADIRFGEIYAVCEVECT